MRPTRRSGPERRIRRIADLQVIPGKALAKAAAMRFAAAAEQAVVERGRFQVALSGGSTPRALFALLARPPYATQLPWAQTEIYWGDERLVPPDDAESNYGQARRLLLDHVPVPPEQVHRIRGELPAAEAAAAYSAVLRRNAARGRAWPRLDLALMGLGADAHTASLFPGSPPATDPVIAVTADYQGRPAARITLTPLVFNDARLLLFLVAGADKAPAVTAVLQGPPDPFNLPAQRLNNAPGDMIWLVDEDAAANLA